MNYDDKKESFDAVLSIQVINHGYHSQIKKAIKEIERVLKPSGYVFITITMRKRRSDSFKVMEIAPRTFVPLQGKEKGLPHFIYNKALLIKDFKNFKIIDFHIASTKHYVLLGRKK